MKKEDLFEALTGVQDRYLQTAYPKRRKVFPAAIAVCACLALLLTGTVGVMILPDRTASSPFPSDIAEAEDAQSNEYEISDELQEEPPSEESQFSSTKPETVITNTADDPEGEIVNLSAEVKLSPASGRKLNEAFAHAVSDFTMQLIQEQIAQKNGENENLTLSPLSVMYALTMTANGADGQTLAELESVLGGGLTVAELNDYFADISRNNHLNNVPLSIANSIWYRDDPLLQVKDSFLRENALFYRADLFQAPFNNTTKDAINTWANDHTDGMIQKVLDEISPDAQLYLINAILFDAEWETPFAEEATLEDTFTSGDGSEQTVSMMHSKESRYIENEEVTGFIKYYDREYAFMALLPKEGVTPETYLTSLTGDELLALQENVQSKTIDIGLPRFKTECSYDLIPVLQTMGIRQAFTGNANFSRMADSPLFIGSVNHDTHIEVNEIGTKAASVTSVGLYRYALRLEPETVILDRPFVYVIYETASGTPILIGVQNSITPEAGDIS